MGMGKPKNDVITPEETMELIRLQQVMNNPNVNNIFGSTSTTFDENDQAHITQTLSPEMQALVGQQMDFVGSGPNQYEARRDPYSQGMMEQFGQQMAERGGFTAPPSYQQPLSNHTNGQGPTGPTLGIEPPADPNNPSGPPSLGPPDIGPTRPRPNLGSGYMPQMPDDIQMPDGITKPTLDPMTKGMNAQQPNPKDNKLMQALMGMMGGTR